MCIIGTMVYFMIRNYLIRNRMRDNYRRNFQELGTNGAVRNGCIFFVEFEPHVLMKYIE